jgi:ubiquinone/menaquinone biosynthesis C-methylase UbiE
MVADLTCANHIPSGIFNCILLTQTLQFIYDVRAALKTLYRILKPAGILLATFSGISQISRYDMDRWGDHWRFTSLSSRRLFEEVFPSPQVTVEAHGNVLTALTFLHGLAVQELRQEELDFHDPDYEVVITVRAVKPEMVL